MTRVSQAEDLIEAYHRRSELALNLLSTPKGHKNEKLVEIKEKVGSFKTLP
jgi:hypothetical protein